MRRHQLFGDDQQQAFDEKCHTIAAPELERFVLHHKTPEDCPGHERSYNQSETCHLRQFAPGRGDGK